MKKPKNYVSVVTFAPWFALALLGASALDTTMIKQHALTMKEVALLKTSPTIAIDENIVITPVEQATLENESKVAMTAAQKEKKNVKACRHT